MARAKDSYGALIIKVQRLQREDQKMWQEITYLGADGVQRTHRTIAGQRPLNAIPEHRVDIVFNGRGQIKWILPHEEVV